MPGPIQSGISNALTTATVLAGGAKQLTQEKRQHEESMIQAAEQHEQLLAEQKHQSDTLAAAQKTAEGVVSISDRAQEISESLAKAQMQDVENRTKEAKLKEEESRAQIAAGIEEDVRKAMRTDNRLRGRNIGSQAMERLEKLRNDPYFILRQEYASGKIGSYAEFQEQFNKRKAEETMNDLDERIRHIFGLGIGGNE